MGVYMKFISVVVLFSQLAFAHPGSQFMGKWEAENVLHGQGVDFQLSFEFSFEFTKLEMTMNVQCHFYDGAYLETSSAVNVDYNGSLIYIRSQQETVAHDGYHFCRSTLRPSVWTAHMNGYGRMILHVPVPYQERFRLVKVY